MKKKILFVQQFLVALYELGIKTIPINDERFKEGMREVAEYFQQHESEFGPYVRKLDMLFLRYSTRGDYTQFSGIIESFNGRTVSLENPHYIKANLKLEQDFVKYKMEDNSLGINFEQFEILAKRFAVGARIEIGQ